jgi:hypothetical protein
VLHSNTIPEEKDGELVITSGQGRMFVQTLLPEKAQVKLEKGADQYKATDGSGVEDFPPRNTYGVGAECRVEISPSEAAKEDFFLHVLTTAEADAASAPKAIVEGSKGKVRVTIGKNRVTFLTDKVGGVVEIKGRKTRLGNKIVPAKK